MKLFLMRHAKAADTYPDEGRKLSERGRAQIRSLCSLFGAETFKNVVQIWHSPYERAAQTAEAVKKSFALPAPLLKVSNITPDDNPAEIARTIASISSFGGDLIMVSHNPFLEELANLLLNVRAGSPRIVFRTCSMAALRLEDDGAGEYGTWAAEFLVHPKLLSDK